MGYVKSTNERWARAESATLRKACEAQTAAGKDCDPAFWQKLIADGLFPGRSWRALQRRAWARKLYRPQHVRRGRKTKLPVETKVEGGLGKLTVTAPAELLARLRTASYWSREPVVDIVRRAVSQEVEKIEVKQHESGGVNRASEQHVLPFSDPLPRLVAGLLSVETLAPDGTVGPVAVPTGGLVIGTDTTNGKALLRTSNGQAIPTTHTFDQVMRAMARAEMIR